MYMYVLNLVCDLRQSTRGEHSTGIDEKRRETHPTLAAALLRLQKEEGRRKKEERCYMSAVYIHEKI
jgi:hypothetical protein